MGDKANSTGEGQGGGTQDDANKDTKKTEEKSGTQTGDKPSEEKKKESEKTFTQADVNAFLAKERRDWEKKAKDAEERAKLSEDERVKAELDSVKRENQMLKAESAMIQALNAAKANAPALLFAAAKDKLEFDADGKLANQKEIIDELKTTYPDQFGTPKPDETIDGGKGTKEEPKGKSQNLSEALKQHYKK